MAKSVSVVIPSFNEGSRIIPVIEAVKQSSHVSEIIVVDDGSRPQSRKILSSQKGIKLLLHHKNQGKTAALKTGVTASKSPIIALIDADLINFTTKDFDSLVSPVINGKYDITLSHRGLEPFYGQVSQFAIAYTGERVINKKLLIQNLDIFNVKNYLFEPIFNQRFFPKYRIGIVYLPKVGQYQQVQKKGFSGWIVNLKQVYCHIKFLGIFGLLDQLFFVLRQKRIVAST
jgi:glycosyltransferase involved in cell wall biosynthesis